MYFHVKRYKYGLSRRKHWIPLILLPVIIYLALSAFLPDRFVVSRTVEIDREAPLSVAGNPVDVVKMSEILARPDELFLDPYTLNALANDLDPLLKRKIMDLALPDFKAAIRALMSLKSTADNHVQISCTSSDSRLGEVLTEFYAERLQKRGEDGLERTGLVERAKSAGSVRVVGAAQILPQRAMWRWERLVPAIQILCGFLILVLVLVGIVEFSHSAFMSERQVARYLSVEVFGSIPNLDHVSDSVKMDRTD